jgi:arylsulfatase A-like enzyme/lysophospholipase L1-like esterase
MIKVKAVMRCRRGVSLLVSLGLILVLGFGSPVKAESGVASRPNVIVLLADDMRVGYTGHEGHPIIDTPNIDRLTAGGTVFSNAFATSAVCTPSRTTLLTGLYERRHGINFNSDSSMTNESWARTYPMLLKDAGYYVGYIGKNHTPVGKNEEGVIGYDSGVMDRSFDYWYAGHKHLGFYPKDKKQHKIFANASADTQVEIMEEGMENFFTPDKAFQEGYDFLDSRPGNKPFALLLNFNVPHGSSTGTMELRDSDLALYRTAYRDKIDEIELPSTYIAEEDIVAPKIPESVYNGEYISTYDYVKNPEDMKEREIRTIQTISGIDKLLGKLLGKLDEQGIAKNTIIVFTSDHGLLHGEHGLGGKVLLYEPSVRVPLIMYDPRSVESPVVPSSEALVALVDIAPTLLELTGVPVPKGTQGKSLQPLMQDADAKWRKILFLENNMTIQNYPRIEGVRTQRWKYVRYFDKAKDQKYEDMLVASINGEQPVYEELFSLKDDPTESRNLVADPKYRKILERLRKKKRSSRQEASRHGSPGYLFQGQQGRQGRLMARGFGRRMIRSVTTSFCLCIFLVACSATDMSTVDAGGMAAGKPNIILLMADDLGWGDTSHNGNSNLKTPSLDEMARSGLVFDRFYSAAPVCSPTRASVLTGRHPFRAKVFFAMVGDSRNGLPPGEVSLGQLMKDAGYRTGFFGKWHLGTLTKEIVDRRFGGPGNDHLYSPPWEHGFDYVFATESRVPTYDPMIRPRSQLGAEPSRHPIEEPVEGTTRAWWEPLDDPSQGTSWGTHYWENKKIVTDELSGDDSRIIINKVLEFTEQRNNHERPFFAVVWFHTPHLPLVAGRADQEQYNEHEFFERTYYGAVSAMDREIGRLRSALKEAGIADNTVLWFTSDNGPESLLDITPGQTGGLRGRKRSLYEGGIRVPGIIEWPARIEAGTKTNVPGVTSDILPTVLGWAGAEIPTSRLLDGKDLDGILQGIEKSRNSPIGFESVYQIAWIDDRYKLVYAPVLDHATRRKGFKGQNPAASVDFELFDIVRDPGESTDLADENPEIVDRMTGELVRWRESVRHSINRDESQATEVLSASRIHPDGKRRERWLFLGDSITQAGHYVDYIESSLLLGSANPPEIIDLGVSSETVSRDSEPDHPFPRPDLRSRLDQVLARTRPDLVVACYGMNDGIYHPFSERRFKAFQDGIRKLIAGARKAGAEIILLTPPPYAGRVSPRPGPADGEAYSFKKPYPAYNDVLQKYADWIMSLDGEDGVRAFDIRPNLETYMAQSYPTEPVHPSVYGHKVMAETFLENIGVVSGSDLLKTGVDSKGADLHWGALLELVRQQRETYDRALLNDIGHGNPTVMKIFMTPLSEAEKLVGPIDSGIEELLSEAKH